MYQLVSAIAKPIDGHTRWLDVEIANKTFISIFATYSKVYLNLTNPFVEGTVSLDLAEIRNKVGTLDVTLADWLVSNGNNTLPTQPLVRKIDTRWVKYADAVHAGYMITPIHDTAAVDYDLPDSEKRALLLTKPGVDYDLFFKNCLVTVNGFFHLMDTTAAGAKVYEGNRSRQLSLKAQCGLYSFREVGEVRAIPITPEMIYKQADCPLYLKTYVDIGEDIGNKTVLLVLGGYLHVMDSTYYRVGEQQFCIDFANYPLLKRLYESRPYVDMSSLNLQTVQRNPAMIAIEDLKDDEVIKAYATLSQSFFVVVDSDDLYVELIKLGDTGLPGMYVAGSTPNLPLRTGFGRMSEYWYTYEDTQWSITCQDIGVPNFNFTSIDLYKERNVDDTRWSFIPDTFSPGFFMKICKDV